MAFCTSLAEWDDEKLTARLAVWTHFVALLHEGETVPKLLKEVAGVHLFGPLIYSLKFTNRTFKHADITTNFNGVNRVIEFPLIEIANTPDGTVQSETSGDIFDRPSYLFGRRMPIVGDYFKSMMAGRYFAVRIMSDKGKVHEGRYELMRLAEDPGNNKTYGRLDHDCAKPVPLWAEGLLGEWQSGKAKFGIKWDSRLVITQAGVPQCPVTEVLLRIRAVGKVPVDLYEYSGQVESANGLYSRGCDRSHRTKFRMRGSGIRLSHNRGWVHGAPKTAQFEKV